MTWLKLSDDFAEDCERAELSDAAFRLHVEALSWTMHRLTDGRITRIQLRKLSSGADPELSAAELVSREYRPGCGFWQALAGPQWQIRHQIEWQQTPDQVEAKRAGDAKRQWQQRQRKHGRPSSDDDYAEFQAQRASQRESRRDSWHDNTRDSGLVWSGLDGGLNPTPHLTEEQHARERAREDHHTPQGKPRRTRPTGVPDLATVPDLMTCDSSGCDETHDLERDPIDALLRCENCRRFQAEG